MHDLPAPDAMYHQIFSSNFQTGKSISLLFISDADEQPAWKIEGPNSGGGFTRIQVMEDLQKNDEEQATIIDLIENMETYLGNSGSSPYSHVCMKRTLW